VASKRSIPYKWILALVLAGGLYVAIPRRPVSDYRIRELSGEEAREDPGAPGLYPLSVLSGGNWVALRWGSKGLVFAPCDQEGGKPVLVERVKEPLPLSIDMSPARGSEDAVAAIARAVDPSEALAVNLGSRVVAARPLGMVAFSSLVVGPNDSVFVYAGRVDAPVLQAIKAKIEGFSLHGSALRPTFSLTLDWPAAWNPVFVSPTHTDPWSFVTFESATRSLAYMDGRDGTIVRRSPVPNALDRLEQLHEEGWYLGRRQVVANDAVFLQWAYPANDRRPEDYEQRRFVLCTIDVLGDRAEVRYFPDATGFRGIAASADGKVLVGQRQETSGASEVVVYNIQTETYTAVAMSETRRPLPVISPGGDMVVFARTEREVWMAQVQGGEARQIFP